MQYFYHTVNPEPPYRKAVLIHYTNKTCQHIACGSACTDTQGVYKTRGETKSSLNARHLFEKRFFSHSTNECLNTQIWHIVSRNHGPHTDSHQQSHTFTHTNRCQVSNETHVLQQEWFFRLSVEKLSVPQTATL